METKQEIMEMAKLAKRNGNKLYGRAKNWRNAREAADIMEKAQDCFKTYKELMAKADAM